MTPSRINSVRERVARTRAALLKPGADLTSALLELQSAAEQMRGPWPETPAAELEALRLDLAHVAKLARNGEDFWRSWGRLLGMEPAYTPGGQLAAEPSASRIAVQG